MGHSYAETFSERMDEDDKRNMRREKIWNSIKDKSLSTFSVKDLDMFLDLLGVERKHGSDDTIYDADLSRMEKRFTIKH